MIYQLFTWSKYALVGPIAGDRLRDASTHFDEYGSKRSPIDPTQSDFLHVHSTWVGLRFDPLRHASAVSPTMGLYMKLSLKDRNGATFVANITNLSCFGSYPREYAATGRYLLETPSYSTLFTDHAFTSDGRYAIYRDVYFSMSTFTKQAYYQVRFRFFSQTNRKQHRYQPYTFKKYLTGKTNAEWVSALWRECLSREPDDDLSFYERSLTTLQLVANTATQGILDCDVYGELVAPNHHYPRDLSGEQLGEWGDLSLECVSQCRAVKSDPYMIAQDVIEFKRLASMIPKSPSDFKNPKYWVNVFLAMKYGVMPTVADGEGIYDDYQAVLRDKGNHIGNTWATLVKTDSTTGNGLRAIARTCHLRYFVEDDPIVKVIRFMYDYNLMPTVNLAWEFIPFSFVVDWFLDVDKFLDAALNYNAWYSTLSVVSVSYSTSETIIAKVAAVPGVLLPAVGTTTRYNRYILSEAIPPIPRFDGSSLSVDNVITGSALFIQRTK